MRRTDITTTTTPRKYPSPRKDIQSAVYEAWRAGEPVTVTVQGVTIIATAGSLVAQLEAQVTAERDGI